jgi:asparagine synthase (glutamine-hydrolysing)
MSVQAGIWNFDGRPVDRKLLADFSESLKQQGPDGESCYADGSVALLYRPFHTTAESRREEQPHFSHRGFILTWDGRLDNRDELIADLRSELEREPADLSIVAAAFDRWEADCFRRIIGDWAVSIWKPQQHELIFASDYMAIRHIFYYLKQERVWWATDLTPLVLLSGDKFHIDDDYIAGYFAHDPEAHLTPYREIREVPPGQFVRIRHGSASVERYWRFSPKCRIRYKTDAEYEEHFRHVFRQSVRRRLRSDSPVLAELSGGLDSSSIVCMADYILAQEGASTPRLDTLSYYDQTEPNGDDRIFFEKVERFRGRAGHHINASKLASAPGSLKCGGFSALPGYLGYGQSLEAERGAIVLASGYRVVLSGLGGDEFLGGIPNPTAHLADLILQGKLALLAKQLIAWSLVKRRPWMHLLWHALMDLLPPAIRQYLVKDATVEPWVETNFAQRTGISRRLLDVEDHFGLWLPTRRSYIGGVVLMGNKLAKYWPPVLGLEESRYPYLDKNLIEFILGIPATQLLRPGERRSLMRRGLTGIVPQEILARRTKEFAARTPILALKKNLEHSEMTLDSLLTSDLGYVNRKRFAESLHAVGNGKEVHLSRMLRTISLELWLRDLASLRLIDFAEPKSPRVPAAASGKRSNLATRFFHHSWSQGMEYSKKGGHNNELHQARAEYSGQGEHVDRDASAKTHFGF